MRPSAKPRQEPRGGAAGSADPGQGAAPAGETGPTEPGRGTAPAGETGPSGSEPPRSGGLQVSPRSWVTTTYFAEGYPYSIVNNLAEILFTELGASLKLIGLTALFHIPWNLKFLWGPQLDRFETKRRWLIGTEVALTLLLIPLALLASGQGLFVWLSLVFLLLAVVAATHDIAIDGFYMEALDEQGQSRFVGFRAMAYKIASLLVRGPLIMLIGWVGWSYGLGATVFLMLTLTIVHYAILPRVERRGRPLADLWASVHRRWALGIAAVVAMAAVLEHELGVLAGLWAGLRGAAAAVPAVARVSAGEWIALGLLALLLVLLATRRSIRRRIEGSDHYYGRAFLDFLSQAKVGRILTFVVLFRAGESFLQKMKWPFLRDQIGLSLEQYGLTNGTLGVIASFAGTLVGGWLIARHGLRRWIWPFVIAQNVLNLLYVGLSELSQRGAVDIEIITAVISVEHFGEGLGTAVFMVYLMRCCDPAHKAAHFAILTALMSVSFTIAGVASGFLAEALGFGVYFGLSFLATVPAMVLIPWLPYLDGRRSSPAPGGD